nr:prolipoprotein diacylglyceryl transferase [Anaerolineae bacterium]
MMFKRYGISVGNLAIAYFALIVLVAFASAYGLASASARRHNLKQKVIRRMTFWTFISALVFGRFLFILNPPPHVAQTYDRAWYFHNLFDFQVGPLAVWSGGLDRAGLALGAIIVIWLIALKSNLRLRDVIRVLALPAVVLLIFIPLANLVNGHFYGPPTDLPWG